MTANINPSPFQKVLRVGGEIVNNSEKLEKVTKMGYKAINFFVAAIKPVSEGFGNLAAKLKTTADIFEGIQFFRVLPMLFCPNEKGEYFFGYKKAGPLDTKPERLNPFLKCADRVCLLFHTGMKTVRTCYKYGLVNLGKVGKAAIGHLPVFHFVTDAWMILSSIFGGLDVITRTLPNAKKSYDNACEKLKKWERRPQDIEKLRAGDQAIVAAFEKKYTDKSAKLAGEIAALQTREKRDADMLNGDAIKQLPEAEVAKITTRHTAEVAKIAELQTKQDKLHDRLTKVANRAYADLANDLSRQNIDGKYGKVARWKDEKEWQDFEKTRSWVRIANAVNKIAVITVASVFGILNFWTAPAVAIVSALGFITDSVGLIKIFLDERKREKMPAAHKASPLVAAFS